MGSCFSKTSGEWKEGRGLTARDLARPAEGADERSGQKNTTKDDDLESTTAGARTHDTWGSLTTVLKEDDIYYEDRVLSNGEFGVMVKPAPHKARVFQSYSHHGSAVHNPLKMLDALEGVQHGLVRGSSFPDELPFSHRVARNGFVDAAMSAYNHHHHLRIRPEDIWFAILTQLSCYVNTHGEELRDTFVSHEGKKRLEVWNAANNETLIEQFTILLEKNVRDPDLRKWIVPAFSTTTDSDKLTASVIMMATLQKYFEYFDCTCCGLPSVTLLGKKEDYKLMLRRVDKLQMYGDEPARFAQLLKPILRRYVLTFEDPESADVIQFWSHIFSRENNGSGPDMMSGWIMAFMFWNGEGQMMYSAERIARQEQAQSLHPRELKVLEMDGVKYHQIQDSAVPLGFCTVPVTHYVDGSITPCEMLAGSVAIHCTSSGEPAEGDATGLDTMQPASGWFYYILPPDNPSSKEQHEAFAKNPHVGGSDDTRIIYN